jgi:membrane-associated phospholipid phosphatase
VRTSESIVVAYAGYLLAVALLVRPGTRASRRVVAECLATALAVIATAWIWTGTAPHLMTEVRNWLPLAYVLALYWMPAHLSLPVDMRAQQQLIAFDHRWALPLIGVAARAPRWSVELLEGMYLLCYPMLPAGFLVLATATADADVAERYWISVVMAAALSYGCLPWIRTYPPRHLEARVPGRTSAIRTVNDFVLHRASVQLNTFPSGHVATATAASLAVIADTAWAGAIFAVVAVLIGVACVVRRYHYLADVLGGGVVGVVSFLASRGL